MISEVQDRQALRRHHHRYHPGRAAPAGPDRRRGRAGRVPTCCAPPVPAHEMDAAAVVTADKNLKYVERDFRHIKSDDLALWPVSAACRNVSAAHVLICMLCLLPDLAPAPGVGAADLHRGAIGRPRQPRSPRPAAPRPRRPRPLASATWPGSPTATSAGLLEHLRRPLTLNQVRFACTWRDSAHAWPSRPAPSGKPSA